MLHSQAGTGSWLQRPRAGEDILSPASPFPPWRSLLAFVQGYANITILSDFFFSPKKWGEGCLFSGEIKQCLPSNLVVMLELRAQLQQSHMERIRENSMPTVWGIFGPPSPEVSFRLGILCSNCCSAFLLPSSTLLTIFLFPSSPAATGCS